MTIERATGNKKTRLTISKLLGVTALIAAGFAFAPRIYNRLNDGLGNAIAVVLLMTILFGAGVGMVISGVEGAVRGALIGAVLFVIAMAAGCLVVFALNL